MQQKEKEHQQHQHKEKEKEHQHKEKREGAPAAPAPAAKAKEEKAMKDMLIKLINVLNIDMIENYNLIDDDDLNRLSEVSYTDKSVQAGNHSYFTQDILFLHILLVNIFLVKFINITLKKHSILESDKEIINLNTGKEWNELKCLLITW